LGADSEEEACEHAFDEMPWPVPENTVAEINAAGRALVSQDETEWRAWLRAYDVLNKWRAAHRFPLNTFAVNLRRSASRIDENALVAQRIKRLASITNKLVLHPQMKLSQMQDIGGCRAVLPALSHVRELVQYYESTSRVKHKRVTKKDYIDSPRESGYRGVHLVYRYFSDRTTTSVYNDMKIEMQIRSQLQHAWATAVETVGMFVGQALKSSMGDEEWRRFFSLMSTAIALRESSTVVPNTPTDRVGLRKELNHYATLLTVRDRLQRYGETLRSLTEQTERAQYYLLELDIAAPRLVVTGFARHAIAEADNRYQEAEKAARDKPELDVVLVSVESVSALEKAYPNYYADTRVFVELLDQELSGERQEIDVQGLVSN